MLARQIAELVQRLLTLAVTLPGLRHLKIFEHLLHLVEQFARGLLVAGARQTLHAIDHAFEILWAHCLGVRIERTRQLLRIVFHLVRKLAHEIIQRSLQIFRELFDLFVAGAAFQGLFQSILRRF